MSKGKPRHNPNKPENLKGDWCGACDVISDDEGNVLDMNCEYGENTHIFLGNPHNCLKTELTKLASLSDKQKNEIRRKQK